MKNTFNVIDGSIACIALAYAGREAAIVRKTLGRKAACRILTLRQLPQLPDENMLKSAMAFLFRELSEKIVFVNANAIF